MTHPERRTSPPPSDSTLYGMPTADIKSFIESERRHDQLDRLREVTAQKRVWRRTMVFCGLLNFSLLCLALIGVYR